MNYDARKTTQTVIYTIYCFASATNRVNRPLKTQQKFEPSCEALAASSACTVQLFRSTCQTQIRSEIYKI